MQGNSSGAGASNGHSGSPAVSSEEWDDLKRAYRRRVASARAREASIRSLSSGADTNGEDSHPV